VDDAFDASIFDSLRPGATVERTLLELKGRLYHLNVPAEKAEFIRDAIAMGNAVRRIGRPGYLTFGVTEALTVWDQSLESVYPGLAVKSLNDRMDQNGRALLQCLESYVDPQMDVEFHWGSYKGPVDPEAVSGMDDAEKIEAYNRGIVAYLIFRFMPIGPYVVSQGFEYTDEDGKRKELRRDSAWTRFGASKGEELRPEEHNLLISCRDTPYVDNEAWHSYAAGQLRTFDASGQPLPPELKFYQPVSGRSGSTTEDALTFLRSWQQQRRTPILFLHGGIGSGKSTLLEQFSDLLLYELETWTVQAQRHESTSPWLPILVKINEEHFDDADAVADFLLRHLNLYGDLDQSFKIGPVPVEWRRRLFDDQDYRFLVMLDGLDELEDSAEHPWKRSFQSIRQFVELHGGHIRAILSARTGTLPWADLPRGWCELKLLPLTDAQVGNSLKKLESPQGPALTRLLESRLELSRLMTCPLAMSAVFDYAESSAPKVSRSRRPTYEVGKIVDRIVTAILAHESIKDVSLQRDSARDRRRKALAELAWKLDGQQEEVTLAVLEEVLGVAEVLRARQMGILEYMPETGLYKFASSLLKAYFAAQHALGIALTARAQGQTVDWPSEFCHAEKQAEFWRLCGDILSSIAWDANVSKSLAPVYQFVASCA